MKTKVNNNVGKDEVTIISAGVLVEGKMQSNGNIRIDGTVDGDISASGNVTIGENGEVNGEITADMVVIGGKIVGTVNAREKLTLEAKALLSGDIITKILVIEAGAKFDGRSSMSTGSKSSLLEEPKAPEKPKIDEK